MEASDHHFYMILGCFFDRFLTFFVKRGASRGDAKNVVLYWYLQCLMAIGLLTKIKKNVVKIEDVFREGCRHHLFVDLGRFQSPFGRFLECQNRKKQVPERSEKTVQKKSRG